MPGGNPNWKPGISGNPSGRKPTRHLERPDKTLADLGVNPIKEILALMPDLPQHKRLEAWGMLLPYLYPRVREEIVEVNPLEGKTDAELLEIIRQKYPEKAA